MEEVKLEIELVPSTAFYTNLRSILSVNDWDMLRRFVYKSAGYKCEICGGKGKKHPVECHEVFKYDESTRLQILTHCQALCADCHEAKHIGLAQIRGFGERAKKTLKRVNGWDSEQVERYVREKFSEWRYRSRLEWKINIDKVRDYGIDPIKYTIKKPL